MGALCPGSCTSQRLPTANNWLTRGVERWSHLLKVAQPLLCESYPRICHGIRLMLFFSWDPIFAYSFLCCLLLLSFLFFWEHFPQLINQCTRVPISGSASRHDPKHRAKPDKIYNKTRWQRAPQIPNYEWVGTNHQQLLDPHDVSIFARWNRGKEKGSFWDPQTNRHSQGSKAGWPENISWNYEGVCRF